MGELKSSGKPFEISKWEVQRGLGEGQGEQGCAGVDGVTIEEFEADLKDNLYKIWSASSRAGGVAMSSG